MAEIIRFPVPPSPRRRRRLAWQLGISAAAFEARIRIRNRELAGAGVVLPSVQDFEFVMACREHRIRPDDICGDDSRADLARRIVRALNAQGIDERDGPGSG